MFTHEPSFLYQHMKSVDQLVAALKSSGLYTIRIELPAGGQLLVLPHGGRAIGLFAPDESPNFFWTNPFLADPLAARTIHGGEWYNVGGDRTWISPEAEFFIRDLNNPLATHKVPVEIDPGSYTVDSANGNTQLVMSGRLHLFHVGRSISVRIVKCFVPAEDPLRSRLNGVSYAGYSSYTTLEILEGGKNPGAMCSLWSLLQLPHGGLAIVSTYRMAEPMTMFGTIPAQDLAIHSNCVAYFSRLVGVAKLSVSAIDTAGRMAYFYHSTGRSWNLIVRSFSVYPSERYIDTPFNDRSCEGSCVQICNYRPPTIAFTELEYHGPATGFGTGRLIHHDCCQTWAYRGNAADIAQIAGVLLGDNAAKLVADTASAKDI
jgi:hypothetical protein